MSKKTTSRKTTTKKADPKKATATKITAKKAAPNRATASKGKGPTAKDLDIYGAATIPWSRALKQLEAGPAGTFWLATTKPDGRPHIAGVGALWVDDKIYVVTGARTRKGRNLAANPSCALSVSLTGIDVVRGEGDPRHRSADAPASRQAVRGAGLARERQWWGLHCPI